MRLLSLIFTRLLGTPLSIETVAGEAVGESP